MYNNISEAFQKIEQFSSFQNLTERITGIEHYLVRKKQTI